MSTLPKYYPRVSGTILPKSHVRDQGLGRVGFGSVSAHRGAHENCDVRHTIAMRKCSAAFALHCTPNPIRATAFRVQSPYRRSMQNCPAIGGLAY